jgi:hypothetical protein
LGAGKRAGGLQSRGIGTRVRESERTFSASFCDWRADSAQAMASTSMPMTVFRSYGSCGRGQGAVRGDIVSAARAGAKAGPAGQLAGPGVVIKRCRAAAWLPRPGARAGGSHLGAEVRQRLPVGKLLLHAQPVAVAQALGEQRAGSAQHGPAAVNQLRLAEAEGAKRQKGSFGQNQSFGVVWPESARKRTGRGWRAARRGEEDQIRSRCSAEAEAEARRGGVSHRACNEFPPFGRAARPRCAAIAPGTHPGIVPFRCAGFRRGVVPPGHQSNFCWQEVLTPLLTAARSWRPAKDAVARADTTGIAARDMA